MSITTARKSILKLVKLQSLVAKCCKYGKFSLAKFAKFVYICIVRGKVYHFSSQISACKLREAIFSVLQHFATKLFTNFQLLFPATPGTAEQGVGGGGAGAQAPPIIFP